MKTALIPPIGNAYKTLAFFSRVIALAVLLLVTSATAFSAAPTPKEEPTVVGSWQLRGKDFDRRYDISSGLNVKILGGDIKEKRGRLAPQPDGSYLVNLDGDAVLRMVYTKADDQLVVECFTKKNLQLGLPSMWKITATRMPASKP